MWFQFYILFLIVSALTGIVSTILFAQAFRKAVYNLPIGIITFVVFWLTVSNVFTGLSIAILKYNETNLPEVYLFLCTISGLIMMACYISLLSVACIRFAPEYKQEDYQCHDLQEAFFKSLKALRNMKTFIKELF